MDAEKDGRTVNVIIKALSIVFLVVLIFGIVEYGCVEAWR